MLPPPKPPHVVPRRKGLVGQWVQKDRVWRVGGTGGLESAGVQIGGIHARTHPLCPSGSSEQTPTDRTLSSRPGRPLGDQGDRNGLTDFTTVPAEWTLGNRRQRRRQLALGDEPRGTTSGRGTTRRQKPVGGRREPDTHEVPTRRVEHTRRTLGRV